MVSLLQNKMINSVNSCKMLSRLSFSIFSFYKCLMKHQTYFQFALRLFSLFSSTWHSQIIFSQIHLIIWTILTVFLFFFFALPSIPPHHEKKKEFQSIRQNLFLLLAITKANKLEQVFKQI